MRKYQLLLFLSAFCLLSCEKDYEDAFPNDYERFINTPFKDGFLQIDASYTFIAQRISSLQMICHFTNYKGTESPKIYVNDNAYVITDTFQKELNEIYFGSNLKIGLLEENNSFNLYMPKELHLYSPELADYADEVPVGVGTILKWNADPKNRQTIGITVSDKNRENTIYTKDNGAYALSSELFNGLKNILRLLCI